MRKLFLSIILVSCLFTMQMHALPLFAASRGLTVVSKEGKSIDLYKDYHAVVIGVSDYDYWPDLPNAVKDAQEVKTQLEKVGFTAELHLNPNAENMNSILANISFTLGRNERDRALLLYFAGHGETTELANKTPLGYIIPRDCPRQDEDPEGFYKKAISMQKMQEVASLVQSKHMLMIFDSCFSGSLFKLNRSPAPAYITEKIARPVRQFITAGEGHGQGPDMSIFKKGLIKGLEGAADYHKDGYITGSELGMYLQNKVVEYTSKQQHPQFGTINDPDLDEGDFVFKLPGFDETAPKPAEEDKRFDTIANEREQEKRKWDEWQGAMEARYRKNQGLDKGSNLTVTEKAQMWGQFLANYATNNPYSTSDDKMREDAKGRVEYWKGQHSKPAAAEGTVPKTKTKTETAKTTPKMPIHAGQLPAIEKIYEENGVQKEVDISFPPGYGIMPGSIGNVYTIDEYDKTESLIAVIEVISITPDGLARAKRTGGSNTIKIKEDDIVRFELEILPTDIDEEIEKTKKLLKSNQNDPIVHYNLGLLYEEKGMLDDSLTSYKKASALNPSMVMPLIGQGSILNKKGESDKAISVFERAIENHPGYAEAYEGLGLVYVNIRQPEDALKAFQKAINLNPNLINSRYNLGILYAKKAQFNEAIAQWEEGLEINPKKSEISYNLGIAYTKLGKFDEAISVWQRALEVNPDMANFYYIIGLTYKEKDDFDNAVAFLKKALEVDSSFADAGAHKALAELYRSKGLMEDAEREARLYKSKSNTVD